MIATLFAPAESGMRKVSADWFEAKSSDPNAMAIFDRHYSARPRQRLGRHKVFRFVGPGECMVLLTAQADALFAWRRERFRRDSQTGIACVVFRNESRILSSDLIRQADDLAFDRWPEERHFTFVNPRKVRSTNPGFCFLKAGWNRCGITSDKNLVILEKLGGGPR